MNISDNNTIELNDIRCDVIHKNIKNIHLRVHKPCGNVRISAPFWVNLETIRRFIISKLGWIRKQQTKLRNQKRETALEYQTHESHHYLGQRYLLQVIEHNAIPKVILKHDSIELYVRKGTSKERRKEVLQNWYRQQLRDLLPQYIEKLEKKIKVKVAELRIKTMKTRWGTCNTRAKRIWINTELAKKPIESLEYVLIHEMVHLLERKHNERFIAYMDEFLPQWRHLRKELNKCST
ncbi:MAG: M48 family metallopeptidase [Gammaproteobacteria bacterium]|nr:M48 family metallopeptidase [Gammaproteobacteria bacterium]